MEDDYAIGLDLGTTFSCIGVYRNGGVEIIPNSVGEKITPSVVIFNEDEILVGEDTTDILVKHHKNCIYEVKRLIGLDFTNKKNKKEFEKLPFKVVKADGNNSAEIEVEIKGENKKFSPVEISSLIIKKMVHNAENYLQKKIKKIVITVPAYFNEDQKKMTEQAANMLDLKVIRIINEPTAAALAYGFTSEKLKDKKILVFDLGGGTFDVSILAFESEQSSDNVKKKNLTVLSISGDMHLGGEDFDNALVEYIIKKQTNQEKIRGNSQAIKKIKVACENIKKILSSTEESTLRLNNIIDGVDINEKITRKEFEQVCQPLFDKLEIPLKTALSNKNLSKSEINEVVLIGGSTRIPKVKDFIYNFFNKRVQINSSINPDEAVAYGATLQAEKILYNKDNIISNFHILDINPFSLGIAVQNESKDKEIQKEGNEMSVLIKRGTALPTFNIQTYQTTADNQTEVSLQIYEGEKKYVKYNHLLKETTIKGLTPKPKGKTKISVEFKIDVNGILFVKAEETTASNGQVINLTIKNDEISYSEEEMEKKKQKMKELTKQLKYKELSKDEDIANIKQLLKNYLDAYKECTEDDEEDKKLYLENFNETMEEFINGFDKNFDNETLLEKFYLYIRELFESSYMNYLQLPISKNEKKGIYDKIRKYLSIFIDKSSAYLNNLLELLSTLKSKRDFNNLIIFVMEKLNECGKEYIISNKQFCKYHSLMFFEQSLSYYEKYLSKEKEAKFEKDAFIKLQEQKKICSDYINDINSGAIILVEESLLKSKLFDERTLTFQAGGTGMTKNYNKLGIVNSTNFQNDEEKVKLVLREYENVLSSIQTKNEPTEKEAVCIANILKLNKILALIDSKKNYLFTLADRCYLIIDQLKLGESKEWVKEFLEIYKYFQKLNTPDEDYEQLLQKVKQRDPSDFEELDEQFNKNRGKIEFINFLITKYPYDGIENDKKNHDFTKYSSNLLSLLMKKYQPESYMPNKPKSEKKYCLRHEITSKLSNLYNNVQ